LELPELSQAEALLLGEMQQYLLAEIDAAGGALPFDRFMEAALYAPGLGYYVNGRRKFGGGGDFTTAPEVSPVFSQCLADQVAECLANLGGGDVLEIGAGSARMASDMLRELEALDRLPDTYSILELSPSLQALQRETLAQAVPHLLPRVRWLQALPDAGFNGVVVGNELLDAMPVHRIRRHRDSWQELKVSADTQGLHDHWDSVASAGLAQALNALWPDAAGVADGFSSEINMRLEPWLRALRNQMARGYVILIDYGYTRREYYHPERDRGTLICHFRHRAYADPYLLPGLHDITANVDFTALAEAALHNGFELAGYTTQAHFLIDTGLDRRLTAMDPADVQSHMQAMQGVKQLTLPSEMGERFKVMALALDTPVSLSGFKTRDLRDRL